MSALIALTIAACGGGTSAAQATDGPAPSGAPKATVLGVSLASPWGLAFLPNGRMLVTQKGGSLVIVRADGSAVEATVSGIPAVNASGQGGLLNVAIDPDFAADPWVYLTYSEDGVGGAGTALARGRLINNELKDLAVIWRQAPKVGGGAHSLADRLSQRQDPLRHRRRARPGRPGQSDGTERTNVAKTLGKVVRLNRDGSIPPGNPVSPRPARCRGCGASATAIRRGRH